MKKNILKAFAVICVLSFASTTFAGTGTITTAVTFGGGTFAPSAKVTIKAAASASAYAATSQHLNGKKQFGTNNLDPKIYFNTALDSGGPTAPANENENFSTGGWQTY